MSDAAAVADSDEAEYWRAGLYALIGRLFFDAPDAALLLQVTASTAEDTLDHSVEDTTLGSVWRQLASVSASADVAALQYEHAMLFFGVGKPPVTPYTSAYVQGVSPERHLLSLRQQLEQWGLAGDAATAMPEDHIAGVCDTMRHLIERGESVAVQKAFFDRFIHDQGRALCERLAGVATSHFYRTVACFTQTFLDVEHEGFDMVSSPT